MSASVCVVCSSENPPYKCRCLQRYCCVACFKKHKESCVGPSAAVEVVKEANRLDAAAVVVRNSNANNNRKGQRGKKRIRLPQQQEDDELQVVATQDMLDRALALPRVSAVCAALGHKKTTIGVSRSMLSVEQEDAAARVRALAAIVTAVSETPTLEMQRKRLQVYIDNDEDCALMCDEILRALPVEILVRILCFVDGAEPSSSDPYVFHMLAALDGDKPHLTFEFGEQHSTPFHMARLRHSVWDERIAMKCLAPVRQCWTGLDKTTVIDASFAELVDDPFAMMRYQLSRNNIETHGLLQSCFEGMFHLERTTMLHAAALVSKQFWRAFNCVHADEQLWRRVVLRRWPHLTHFPLEKSVRKGLTWREYGRWRGVVVPDPRHVVDDCPRLDCPQSALKPTECEVCSESRVMVRNVADLEHAKPYVCYDLCAIHIYKHRDTWWKVRECE